MSEMNMQSLPVDERRLLKAIFEDADNVDKARRLASEWRSEHGQMLTEEDVIRAVEVAQMTVAEDFDGWPEMDDAEKNDISEVMCGLVVARDLIAHMFGRPTLGRVEETLEEAEEEEHGQED